MDQPAQVRTINHDVSCSEFLQYSFLTVRRIQVMYLCFVVLTIASFVNLLSNTGTFAITMAVLLVGVCALIPYVLVKQYNAHLDRMLDVTTTIRPDMVINRSNRVPSELQIEWKRINNIQVAADSIIFHLQPPLAGAICIPFRCFPSRAAAQEFFQQSFDYWKDGQSRKHADGKCLPKGQDQSFWTPERSRIVFIVLLAAVVFLLINYERIGVELTPVLALPLFCFIVYASKRMNTGTNELLLANTAYDKGNYSKALDITQKALKKYPNNADLHCTEAAVYVGLGRMKECVEACNRAIEINPENAFAIGNRAIALREMCRFEYALEDATRAVALEPNLSGGIVFKAAIQLDTADYADALKSCDEAIRIDGRNASAHRMKALIFARMNEHIQAITMGNTALDLALKTKRKQEIIAAHASLATIYSEANEHASARDQIQKALAIDSKDAITQTAAAYVFTFSGEFAEVEKAVNAALTQQCSNRTLAFLHNARAFVELQRGNLPAAEEEIDKALELCVRAIALATKALVLARNGNYTAALEYSNKAITADPHHAMSYWVRHLVQEGLGDTEGSQIDLATSQSYKFHPFITP